MRALRLGTNKQTVNSLAKSYSRSEFVFFRSAVMLRARDNSRRVSPVKQYVVDLSEDASAEIPVCLLISQK